MVRTTDSNVFLTFYLQSNESIGFWYFDIAAQLRDQLIFETNLILFLGKVLVLNT
jgi:hypothetical protein